MNKIIAVTTMGLAAVTLASCATTKPDPAKICTADWISARSVKAVDRIEDRTGPALRNLTKAAKKWAQGKKPGPLQMMALNSSVNKLTKELQNGRGMKDLKTISSTCNDPKIVSQAMTNLMRRNGLPEGMINFVEALPRYKDLISVPEITTPETRS